MLHFVFLVECADLAPAPGVETLDARFFAPDRLPEALHHGHDRGVPKCIGVAQEGETFFDPAASYGMDLPMHQRPGAPPCPPNPGGDPSHAASREGRRQQ